MNQNQIDLHKRDHNLLLHFKNSLGGIGLKVYVYNNLNKVRYYISTKEDLRELILTSFLFFFIKNEKKGRTRLRPLSFII